MSHIRETREIWSFLMSRKKFWLMPVFLVLLIIGLIVALSASSALAPFIYTLF